MSFMEIAKVIASKSKDPSTKVGSVIVDSNDRIISTGYNGFVSKNNESLMTFERPLKYHLTIHAEMNALLFAKQDLYNKIIYITHSPCVECLKHILQCGIRTVYYDKLYSQYENIQIDAINRLIKSTGANVVNINNNKQYIDDLTSIEETLCIIKPDAYCRFTEISNLLQKEYGKDIVKHYIFKQITREEALLLYSEHKERENFEELISFMTSGPSVIMILGGPDIVKKHRAFIPEIRRIYSSSVMKNAIHGSDSAESAKREIQIFRYLKEKKM